MTHSYDLFQEELRKAYESHPEITPRAATLLEDMELIHFNRHYRHEFRDIEKHKTTLFDIINNFDTYKEMCQEELWELLDRTSRDAVHKEATGITVIGRLPYEYIAQFIIDTEKLKKHKELHNDMMAKAKEIRTYIK